MNREDLILQLGTSLKAISCHGLKGIDRSAMEWAVDAFVRDDIRQTSSEDILRKFVTPRGSLEEFMCYLDRRICSPACRRNRDLASACTRA